MDTIFNTQEEPILKGIVENLKMLTPEEQREVSILVQAYKLARTREAASSESA